jgi:hypothetical protein
VINTGYLGCIYYPKAYVKVVEAVACYLEKIEGEFETLAFSGSSGAAVAYPVAALIGCHLSHVRKADGNHFSSRNGRVEGYHHGNGIIPEPCRYIIIDDFVESGGTLERIIEGMYCKPTQVILYDGNEYHKEKVVVQDLGCPVITRGDLGGGRYGWHFEGA